MTSQRRRPAKSTRPAARETAADPLRFAGLIRSSLLFAALLVAAAVVTAVVGTGVTGTADVVGIGTPGPVVRFGVPVARVLLDLGAVTATGLALLSKLIGYERPGQSEPVMSRARRFAVWASAVWAVGAFASIVLLAWEVGPGFPGAGQIWAYLVNVPAGKGLLLSGACALGSVWLAMLSRRRGERVPAELRVGIALFGLLPLPLTGHASTGYWHDLGTLSMELHVVAASAWAGGLGAVLVFLGRDRRLLAVVLPRFSTLATWCVLVVGVTGLFSGLVELALSPATDLPANLFTTRYGVLMLAKIAFLGIIAVTASVVRFRLLPRVASGHRTALAVWAGWELLVLALAFGVAVVLVRAPVTPF